MKKSISRYLDQLLVDANLIASSKKLSKYKVSTYDFSKEIILITGAAGSIGSELSKQLLKSTFKKLILIDIAESPLYNLIKELDLDCTENVEFSLLDILDKEALKDIFEIYKPTIVFHTAAYKHVPLMENNPYEAVKLNIFGTKLIADIANDFNVKKFIFISTDKAVNPVNVMGMSKKIAENYLLAKSKLSETTYVTTRFGNIFGSNGSVVSQFRKQIALGLPLTVTDKHITRYFISNCKACNLILNLSTFEHTNYTTFTFNMGDPVKIIDLATKLLFKFTSLKPSKNIKITGLRPGEKLHESLSSEDEYLISTDNKEIFIVRNKYNQIPSKINFTELKKISPLSSKETVKSILKNYL